MMKPKTKLQIQVVALSKKLPKLKKEQRDWAYAKIFKFYALKTKHTSTCFECGHQWKEEQSLIPILLGTDCPKCGKHLELAKTKAWKVEEVDCFSIISVFQGFQVIRMFQIRHWCKKGKKATYACQEVYQHWISQKGKLVILAIKVNAMGYNYYGYAKWLWGSDMEVRQNHDRYYYNGAVVCPGRKILPVMRRNGFKGSFHKLNISWFFQLILSYPKAETLLKSGQIELFKTYGDYGQETRIIKYWSQIKICIRNNYKIKDPSIWFDQLELLEYFKKDLYNAKYICPNDLAAEHQRLIDKKQEIRAREDLERMKAKIEKANKTYQKDKGQFFGISLSNGEIKVIVPDSVKEIYIEGEKLHHCVFSNDYYKKKDTLILSARKGSERLETIELSLKSFNVIQSRGACNKNTPYHDQILDLVNSNIQTIKKLAVKAKQPERSRAVMEQPICA